MDATETFGKNYAPAKLLTAREKTWQAVTAIAQQILPGMSEAEAETVGIRTLRQMGARKFWHPVHIRFGKNTLKGYRDKSEADVLLKDSDIFFIDIGPIFDGHEGDCGRTFTVGDDRALAELAQKSKDVFDLVRQDWQKGGLTGVHLWERAQVHARNLRVAMQPPYVKGHRISDFPHEMITNSKLFDYAKEPAEKCWILEIQIQDPVLGLGSFYEDLL